METNGRPVRDPFDVLQRLDRTVLFDLSPIPSVIQDWSGVFTWVEDFARSGLDLEAHLDLNPDTVVDVFSLVEIVAANQAYLDFEGLDVGTPPPTRFDPRNIERAWRRYRDHLVRISREGIQTDWLVDSRTRNGRPIHVRVTGAAHPSDPALLLVTFEDFTAARDAQHAIRAANRSRDELVAAVAHELRTPMTAVVGFSAELESRGHEIAPAEFADLISIIAGESRALAAMVDDLLVVSRLGRTEFPLERELVDLNRLVTEVVAASASVEIVHTSGPTMALGDAERIRQIVRNLVNNAHRHGGPTVRVVVGARSGKVAVEVRDDGHQIAPNMLSRIFEPYVSGASRVPLPGSAGLGLAVARGLAERMGGSLETYRDGDETVFRLELEPA